MSITDDGAAMTIDGTSEAITTAFEQLQLLLGDTKFRKQLLKVARKRARKNKAPDPATEAHDAVQMAFEDAIRAIQRQKWSAIKNPKAWLTTVVGHRARQAALDTHRQGVTHKPKDKPHKTGDRLRPPDTIDPAPGGPIRANGFMVNILNGADLDALPEPPGWTTATRMLTAEDVRTAIEIQERLADLAEPEKIAFAMQHVYGFSMTETAAYLRCPDGTVKSRTARARTALRKSILPTALGAAVVAFIISVITRPKKAMAWGSVVVLTALYVTHPDQAPAVLLSIGSVIVDLAHGFGDFFTALVQ